ncbi:MAG TPA: hypothetical protein GX726_05335 [Clostridiales bacterium]|jgi:uncharacterized protein YjdB|nr:hypothetical protein [Clostridiales bacterium]
MRKMSKSRRLLLLISVLALIVAVPAPALASNAPAAVTPSDTLNIYVRINGNDTLLHTYSLSEMNSLSRGATTYSAIDNMPCPVITEAEGVYLDDLIADAAQYTNYNLMDYQYLRTRSTDGATGKFTEAQLFGERYYFPMLHKENGAWNSAEAEVDVSVLGQGTKVQPMLAISSYQERRPAPADKNDTRRYNPERYTLLFGSTMDEMRNCEQRVSQYRRGCCDFIIDLGSGAVDTSLTGLSLDCSSLTLARGGNAQLSVIPQPITAINTAVSWSSSDVTVAKVSTTGVVTAQREGSATITVTAQSNISIKAVCQVTVTAVDKVAVSGITLSPTRLTLAQGGEKQLLAVLRPFNATNTSVIWRSADPEIATVTAGGLVKAIKAGKTTITVAAEDGGFQASCELAVTEKLIPLTGLALSRNAAVIAKGESLQLEAQFTPNNTTEQEVTWSSSQPGVASVSTNGLVYGRNLGVSVITLRSADGKYSATCQVTVAKDAVKFTDVSGHWAKSYIDEMATAGYINGYSDASFRPDRSITRAEFLSILMRILHDKKGVALSGTATFSDTSSHWAKDYIAAAVEQKIAGGMGNNQFRPDAAITREQITLMLCNAVRGDGSQMALNFTDGAAISSWARDSVAFALSRGWVSGYGDGSFGPGRSATRGEVCAMLSRFCQQL